ncbi:MAG: M13 family metallopeptidase [Ignavibacteriaceae bacterium]|nr:M13 family metallopeptidase [Ignavibacteriaceae bacterium]
MKHFKLFALTLIIFCSTNIFSQEGDFLTKNIDKSINPGTDFFKYATGTWMKNNPIPVSERAWGIGNLVQEETYARLKSILEESSSHKYIKGTSEQKVGDFYYSGMDTLNIEKQGITPLSHVLSKINTIQNKKELLDVVARLQVIGVDAMFGDFVGQDQKNSDQWAFYLWQGGLGLPNREYYFRNDARTENIRKEYNIHLSKMFLLLGENQNIAKMDEKSVYEIELFLADSSRKLEDLRDPYTNYNKMTITELQKSTPNINWVHIFSEMGIKKLDDVIVGQPEFLHQLNAAINKFNIDQWKAYLKWGLINSMADRLSSAFNDENFHFKGTVMSGVKEQRPRWKRVQDYTEGAMGELLGQVYVKKYCSPKVKERYEQLVNNIMAAFGERVKRLDWMSSATKEKALIKLAAVTKKVCYPDKWKDFSKLSVDRSSLASNTIAVHEFWFNREINKLGKPVDRSEWDMTPQTYNAYYNPSNNEIVLPYAGFVVPGVPDSLLDDAFVYSYGGASTIGHELTHGFDDQGRQYDPKGNLQNWWTDEDVKKFEVKTDLMVEQFNNYIVLDSMHINGKATLGENIADLGGLVTGYDAFKKTEQYKEGKLINGFTPGQRFWLGYAYSWLGHQRNESLAQRVMTDVHSPNFLRVNGPYSDISEFYSDFNIKEGDAMYRPESKRVKIW